MTNPTIKNILTYFKIEEWEDEEVGFSFIEKGYTYDNEKLFDKIHTKMYNEIRMSFGDKKKKSLMWIEEVKHRSNWKKGDIIYGYAREKHYTYQIDWNKNEKKMFPTFIIDPQGFVALSVFNHYSSEETDLIKDVSYIRPNSLYNDKIDKLINK